VEVVMECTGQFLTTETISPQLAHAGVKKIVVSAPVKSDGILNIVVGCNDHLYDASKDHIVTAASCTTNCLAPVVKVIHENLVRASCKREREWAWGTHTQVERPLPAGDSSTPGSLEVAALVPHCRTSHITVRVQGIERGAITTIHDVTNTQTVVDSCNSKKADLRRARSSLMSLAPTSTGMARHPI
jgi:glyceraldehyde 3-phosphate dehydrogenase